MTSNKSWVTLATNDSYALGALVLAHSLKNVGTIHNLTILITPGVTATMKEQIEAVFHDVRLVDVLDSKDQTHLALMSRPELGITFTKLHCWTLINYEKCVFLDADTLVLQNCDELFEREELSAAPDPGWPDCFNSGVFVFKPSENTFNQLLEFAKAKGSFDGGDQGLLNMFFKDWAYKDISKHLSFTYNVVWSSTYSYLPALKQFGQNMKIVHFIASSKPWLQKFDTETRIVTSTSGSAGLQALLQLWWDLFCKHVYPVLSNQMNHIVEECNSYNNVIITHEKKKVENCWENVRDFQGQVNNENCPACSNEPPFCNNSSLIVNNSYPDSPKPFEVLKDEENDIDNGGLAAQFATLSLGEKSADQKAVEDFLRRQSWEHGNVDYLGKDSFSNIWAKINDNLVKKTEVKVEPTVTINPPPPEVVLSQEKKPLKSALKKTSTSTPPNEAELVQKVEPPVKQLEKLDLNTDEKQATTTPGTPTVTSPTPPATPATQVQELPKPTDSTTEPPKEVEPASEMPRPIDSATESPKSVEPANETSKPADSTIEPPKPVEPTSDVESTEASVAPVASSETIQITEIIKTSTETETPEESTEPPKPPKRTNKATSVATDGSKNVKPSEEK
ncbi:glycogenin-1 isoform X1 [Adelges cooleyi]|uniref:glycogenin-1 isoform X1 n=1 Tax=Adelges cooleyi TaxID=133065 RepID=UPI00217FB0A0|nr:glycogenin-1 isoform X1 [Adelges cooleyi]